ncbi:non-specific serine/threonine protein kinase [Malassezia cuniculi]|uniref:Serine/threonine-protein kinase RIO2 n=1 Tax=Malassezia cuniculi TaxID=948313 RepID=A0AAF0EPH7_9BASI|nr:non-specific serine/threonine protein kinase [Malassezia cuniculi]
MKLDATDVRYLSPEEFRILTAVEMGSKNHEVVPSPLIAQISSLRHAGINKLLGELLKRKLVARVQNNVYDGFRLTYGGYDYLAIRALSKRKSIYAVGNQIGVGKESDIYLTSTEEGEVRVLKIHRLGRISFRKIKEKRDYMGKRKSASWMYMSRLAAQKEFAFMRILHEHGFPVPTPIDQSRHTLVMSYEDAYPLRQIAALPANQIPKLYSALMELIVRLARAGLIHGDFNEFNLLVREVREEDESEDEYPQHSATPQKAFAAQPVEEQAVGTGRVIGSGKGFERLVVDSEASTDAEENDAASDISDDAIQFEDGVQVEPVLIDFPQMVSVDHTNAEYYFMRDVHCVRRFFFKRFRYESDDYPRFAQVRELIERDNATTVRLDALARASGFGHDSEAQVQLETQLASMQIGGDEDDEDDHEDEDEDEDDESDVETDEGDLSDVDTSEEEEEDAESIHSAAAGEQTRLARQKIDSSELAARVASDRARRIRRSEKHHGRRAQSTKVGRRHGGGKAKHNARNIVHDSSVF